MRYAILSICLTTFAASLLLMTPTVRWANAASAFTDCEGAACSSVTLTFDDAKQQYKAQNNSSDHWVKVSASNLAASASACIAPGKEGYLSLKSVTSPYRADYVEDGCGDQAASW